ncbi:hypothetical protein K2173_011298 [Erythroxylum novogranatense]|uniref:SWIM-type domain-containing protein n=1 Tax=Erythroxylum novogranatense TaxID=1862640 RepID=A0AAV8S9G7_9ROSI|nr:hypothetical protein K2173_011298 [Erythroxylum novogranatense]
MARWDEILSLPVQNPPSLEFSAADLVWSKVEGWRDNIDRLALIPFARVDDFVRGESANRDCPTRFHVEARRRRPPKAPYKQKVDGILEYILYWCSFGPDDHRKGGIVRPSRTTYVPKKKNAGRPNTKRGCTCHFIVKRLIAEPSVALIIYNQDKHVDKKGLPCHGPQDKKAEGTRAMFAPYISEDLRLRVLSLLHVGVSVETIMQRHNESVEKQGGPCNRDDLLTHRYVRRQERSIRRSTYELDEDDAVSVSLWVETHQSNVFFYEDFSDSDPLTLGIQTEWQLQQMIRFGNRSLMASDSRFGTNKLKYPIYSLLVFNSDNKAIPVAWIITPSFADSNAHRWMRALYNRVCNKDPTWNLAGFIVDDPSTDILTIRDVFQCSVLISFWRVRHLWHKNLVKRCPEIEMRAQMSNRLALAFDDICTRQGSVNLFEAFVEDFVDSFDFVDYFKAIWHPRIGSWVTALKTLPLASQEMCAAIEFYHNQLKVRLLNEKDPSVYQHLDWLVYKLGTKVHSYFWLDEYSDRDDFARYWKDEWVTGLTSWRKALEIADSDVIVENRFAQVTNQVNRDKLHMVWNPGSEFAICDCSWAEMGNLCEHVFKVIRLYRQKGFRKPSISLFQYNKALIDMLLCPPRDSLIRDHAVSLSVAVQKQLNALVSLDICGTAEDINQKQAVNLVECEIGRSDSAHEGREFPSKSLPTNEDPLLCDENRPEALEGANGCLDHERKIIDSEMDIDPPSIYSSPVLDSVNKVTSDDAFPADGNRTTDDVAAYVSLTLTSEDSILTDQVGVAKGSAMDVEPFSAQGTHSAMDVEPLSAGDTCEECTTINRDVTSNNSLEALAIASMADASSVCDTSLSASNAIESQRIDAAGTCGTSRENSLTESDRQNEQMENNCSTNNANNNETNPDSESTSVDTLKDAELLSNFSSTSSHGDNPPLVKVADEENGCLQKPSLIDKSTLTRCTIQEGLVGGKIENDSTNAVESDKGGVAARDC